MARDDSPSCYLGPHLGCLEWLGSSASLSMKSITEGFLHVERSIIRGRSKKQGVWRPRSEISKLLWSYSNKTEHKARVDSRGRRFHLSGVKSKRMGGMVVAIFANNLPHVFNRKPIMVRAERKYIYVSFQYMKKRHVIIKSNTYSRFKQKTTQ